MPRLPTIEQMGPSPVPRERGQVVPLNLASPRPEIMAAPGNALGNLGNALGGWSDVLYREHLRASETRAEDAYVEYSQQLQALELDPEVGFVHKHGGDAVKGQLLQKYQQRRNEIRKQIEETLNDATQKELFRKRAAVADLAFDGKLYRHLASEMDTYQTQVFQSLLAQKRVEAALGWDQPKVLETSIVETESAIERQAKRLGLDAKTTAQMKRTAVSQLHSEVINRMLLDGKDDAALAYYRKVKDALTTQDASQLDRRLKTVTTYSRASSAVDDVWVKHGPKNENEPIRLFSLESRLRKRLKDNPAAMQEAISQLRQRAAAWEAEQRQLVDSRKARVLDAFNKGTSLNEVVHMPEFQALDGEDRDLLLNHLRKRSIDAVRYDEWLKAKEGHVLYWRYSDPKVLSQMSEENIIALEPKIGQEYTAALLQMKRSLATKQVSLSAATIDQDMFKYLAKEAGINAYKPSPKEKQQLGRLKYVVEGQINQYQESLGRKLKREEKEALMRKILDQQVMLDRWLLPDKPVKAALVMPEEYEDIYVPLDQIPQEWKQERLNYLRSIGVIPPLMSDNEAQKKVQDRLEHAYAVYKVGGSEELVARLLQGVPTDEAMRQ